MPFLAKRGGGGAAETLVTSVEVISPFAAKWTFDHDIAWGGGDVGAGALMVGAVQAAGEPSEVGVNYLVIGYPDFIKDDRARIAALKWHSVGPMM